MPFALTVFSDIVHTHKSTRLVNSLRKYFEVYVDAVNTAPILLKHKYGGSFHRFFGHDCSELIMFDHEVVDMIDPEFIVTFDKDIGKENWKKLFIFFRNLLDEIVDPKYYETVKELTNVQTNCDLKIDERNCEIIIEDNTTDQYLFDMYIDEDRDMAYFQITRPRTDRPYTTIIRAFKDRGYLPLFTSLYMDKSWGFGDDSGFLKELWVHLGLNYSIGVLDLEKELKKHILRCTPGNGVPEAEPEVYRMSIDNVKQQFENRNKRYNEVMNDLNVKRQCLLE